MADARGGVSWAVVPTSVALLGPSSMGPSGRWPDDVPPYDTPATRTVTSVQALPAAVASAAPGDVIEHPGGHHVLTSHLEFTGGPPSGPKVLVRPPLGQRASFSLGQSGGRQVRFRGSARNVCLAGWTVGSLQWRMESVSNITLARFVWEGSGHTVIRGVHDLDMVEHVRAEMSTHQGSALHLIRNDGARGSVRVRLSGWWHAGMWRAAGQSNQAKDTLQTFHLDGGTIDDVTVEDSVLFASSDKVMQNHHWETRRLRFVNTWMNRPEDPYWEPPSGYTTHGSFGHVAVQEPGRDVEIDGCTILGSMSNTNATGTRRDSVCRGGSAWDALTDLGGNQTLPGADIASHPPPPLPDLDHIWHP